ncbi:MAG: ABC transporter ATP-binding protein/permease, partial [Defluviitaleaceae bacterium]|nr:ABC transporter ATP-binding protein/permease [Defluviitaleaceae bacterium]
MKNYIFEFDLSMTRQPETGTLTFSEDGIILVERPGEAPFSFHASQVEEALVKAGVGCGLLYVKQKEAEDRILCRFTMSCLKKAGDFCKVINYYVQSGAGTDDEPAYIPEDTEMRLCPNCGQPLMEEIRVCMFCYDKLSVLARAFAHMRPYKRVVGVALALFILNTLLFLTTPLINRVLIDDFLRPQVGSPSQIIWLAAFMLFVRIFGETLFIVSARLYNRASIDYCNDLRILAYDKLQSHSMASFAKRTPGDLIRRIIDDTAHIREFITDMGRWAVELALMFVVVLIILMLTNWQLTLMVFIPVPIVAVFMTRFWAFIRARYERQWRKRSKCQSILHDIIKGIRTVKSFGNEEAEIKKYASAERELAQISSENEITWAKLFPVMTFFTATGEFIILLIGGYAVLRGEMSIGVMIQFTMFVGFIYGPLRFLVSFPRWLGEATTSMVKVFEILDEEPDIAEKPTSKRIPIAGGVKFEGVSFGYKSYEPVLKGVDLEIKPGEMVGLVGKSGVGKSTLINLVMRLYDPNMGRVMINDTDLRDISPNHLHENIGVVFQDSFLFAGSFYDNIAYAKPNATYEDVIAASKAANAHDFIVKTPDGYNTLIGEGGESLSGGERQRLSIARAIIKNPDILILDEATSSLDVETEAAIQESLDKLIKVKGRTTIAIAHRLSTLRNADRLIVLDKGGVAEIGTHVELLKKKG